MLPLTAYNKKKVLKCIIMAGQSNMEGGDSTGSPTAGTTEVNNSFTFFKPGDTSATDNGYWQTQIYNVNNNWRSVINPNFNGPELNFAKQWQNNHPNEPILIIKYAFGGSSLVDEGAYVNGHWQIDATNAPLHYPILINNFAIPAIQKLNRNGVYTDIVALSWCQGEADANSSTAAAVYETQLKRLVDQLRIDLSPYNVRGSNIKPIITRIHNNFSPPRPYQDNIRTALVNVANYYGVSWINSDAYALAADFTHWTRAGQDSHGQNIYTIFNNLI